MRKTSGICYVCGPPITEEEKRNAFVDSHSTEACIPYLMADRDSALAAESRARGEAERMAALATDARDLIDRALALLQNPVWQQDAREWLSRWPQTPPAAIAEEEKNG